MPEPTDSQSESDDVIFRRFIAEGDRDALGELVRRYAGLVYASARRQVRDPDLAEDVMQNVFVTFARRAREIRSVAALGTWLLQTARYAAANAVKTESRRRTHEHAARLSWPSAAREANPVEAAIAEEENQWRALSPLLDEALSRLVVADQTAVILRFLRGLSLREVGLATGTTEEGARKRVSRAIDRLRKQLAALGVQPAGGGTAALSAILVAHAIEPASPSAVANATSAALAAASSVAKVAGVSLFHGAVAMTTISKLAVALAVAVLLFAGGVGALHLVGVSLLSDGPAPSAFTSPPVAPRPVAPAPILVGTWQTRFNLAYSVAPSQAIKCVARPYIPERRQWYQANILPQQVRSIPNPNQIIFKQGADGTLRLQILFGDENVRSIALNVTGLRAWQIAGDATLLRRRIRGDWVVSGTASTDAILAGLAEVLRQSNGMEARFIHNRVERDVIVVSGQLRSDQGRFDSPRINLEMTDQQILAHSKNGGGNFKAMGGGVDFLLDNLSEATETPFIDECVPHINNMIEFGARQMSDSAASRVGLAPDQTLLRSLVEQSELSFTPERRTVDIWTLSY
jgi:RNA polymerase sigma factor (sigma-70 family)